MYYILLDETQLVDGFEFVLNGLLYEKNLDVYVTGSNSKFLSSDIITEFRGRSDQVKVSPLSFSEFVSVFDGDKYEAWNEYVTYGGMPLTFIAYIEDAFIVNKSTRYDIKGKKYIQTPQKYYFTDIGLRNARLNLDTQEKTIQESKSLNNIGDSFKKIIIVKDNIKLWRTEDGIVVMGIQEFLLNQNSLEL